VLDTAGVRTAACRCRQAAACWPYQGATGRHLGARAPEPPFANPLGVMWNNLGGRHCRSHRSAPARRGVSVQRSSARCELGAPAASPFSRARAALGTSAAAQNLLRWHKASQHAKRTRCRGTPVRAATAGWGTSRVTGMHAAAHLHFFQHFEEFCRL